jgi:hypothetical protein
MKTASFTIGLKRGTVISLIPTKPADLADCWKLAAF